MNRRQFILGAASLAALKVIPVSADAEYAHADPEALAMQYLEKGEYTLLMRLLIGTWDPDAPRLVRIPTGEVVGKPWETETYAVMRSVVPSDPEWNTIYWQFRVLRTAKMRGVLDTIAMGPSMALFSEWSMLAKGKVL